ncbi:acetyl-CoA hydrolase/transferase C-terminal domain-containing protein [Rhodobacter sp. NTK016B]|uniref:acetyl-CoA hydrolase/transferase C-terminal domain-containing protein n=1 Tax=Rhodobacter sp. NTK016B TaxID=2759676 RepID=UPI00256FCB73|nr:acetyl-CoA hydrolase/transferase C-terminal domain-containing protein [Rhodobacter sp. NTK016B]
MPEVPPSDAPIGDGALSMGPVQADSEAIAEALISRCGPEIRLALPLGLGKPVTLVDALTRAVARRPDIRLSIVTALTLEPPNADEGMAKRFLGPARTRLFGDYPVPYYAQLLREGRLPDNIEVAEFFMLAGRWLGVEQAQRHYIASNYTHALDVVRRWQPNLVLQLLAEEPEGALNLACNTDITADLLRDRQAGRLDFILAGETNAKLPAMPGPAATISHTELDYLLRDAPDFDLFSVVKRPVGLAEHAIGLQVAGMIRDGGTLQIGIGAIGDAVAHAMIARHEGRIDAMTSGRPFAARIPSDLSERGSFRTGLYCVTEMLVDGLLHLFEAGVIRREVDGAAIHAGFFVDCRDFYKRLAAMPPETRTRLQMVPVSFTNQLYGEEGAKRAARQDARFVNSAMKATLLGGIVSDATSDGREVSGVGGQFNFIEQAFALDGARAIITLPSTRESGGEVRSNIVWDHPHESVPRAYRDVVVTEYGVADLRGRRDEEVVRAMLRVADSRFQPDLVAQAKKAGKLPDDFTLPEDWTRNTPEALAAWLGPKALPDFPFGTDFTPVEQRLLPALDRLSQAQASRRVLAGLVWDGLRADHKPHAEALERMGLDRPAGTQERLERWALLGALKRAAGG